MAAAGSRLSESLPASRPDFRSGGFFAKIYLEGTEVTDEGISPPAGVFLHDIAPEFREAFDRLVAGGLDEVAALRIAEGIGLEQGQSRGATILLPAHDTINVSRAGIHAEHGESGILLAHPGIHDSERGHADERGRAVRLGFLIANQNDVEAEEPRIMDQLGAFREHIVQLEIIAIRNEGIDRLHGADVPAFHGFLRGVAKIDGIGAPGGEHADAGRDAQRGFAAQRRIALHFGYLLARGDGGGHLVIPARGERQQKQRGETGQEDGCRCGFHGGKILAFFA